MPENSPRSRPQIARRLRESGAVRLAAWLTFLFFMGCVVCGAAVAIAQTIAGADGPKAVANGMRFADLPVHIMASVANVLIFAIAMGAMLILLAGLWSSDDDD